MRKNKEKNFFHFFNRQKFFLTIVFILAMALSGIFFWLWSYFQQPAIGRVNNLMEKDLIENEPEKLELFEGKYFSFFLNSEYILKKHQNEPDQNNIVLESVFFSEKAVDSKKIAVTIENLPDGVMQNSASYNMREKKSERYQKENFQIEKIKGIFFELKDENSFEKTFFIQRGNLLAIVSFTASLDEKESLKNENENIVASFNWR